MPSKSRSGHFEPVKASSGSRANGFTLVWARIQRSIDWWCVGPAPLPRNSAAYHALGLKLQEWGHLDEALAAYRNAVDADPNLSKPHFMLGLALVEQSGERKLEEAIVHFRSAVRLEPDNLYAHFYLGMALEKSGRQAEALPAYREALRIDPRFQAARQRLSALERVGAGN